MTTLEKTVLINPFIEMRLKNLKFGAPRIDKRQVFYSDFGHAVTLTPLAQGIHLPESIFAYMDYQFFNYICHAPVAGVDGDIDHNAYLTLERCECRGRNYYGMPNFDIETK